MRKSINMRKFINILVLVVALVGTVSALNLDDLSKKVNDRKKILKKFLFSAIIK